MNHIPPPAAAAVPDDQTITGFHARVIALCALVAVLDGVDTQTIGVAAPSIAASLGVKLAQFGPVFSAAVFGAMVGALACGSLADRVGRKRVLIAATLIFAVFTACVPLAGDLTTLAVLRFCAGVGLGGATPCFLALAAENAPSRMRATVVSLTWAGFPLGGVVAGFGSSWLLTQFPWPVLFYVGGALPLLLAGVLAVGLPESAAFLAARDRGAAAGSEAKVSVGQLFADGRWATTLLLWVPFVMAFGALIVIVLWTPALLRANGMSPASAGIALAFHGMGAVVGMASAGKLVQRFGAVRALVPALCIGAACTVALGQSGNSLALASLFMVLTGVFVGAGASGAIALAALAYPVQLRSTGLGWAMAMGRGGQALAPLLAGWLLGAGFAIDGIFRIVGAAPVIAALFVVLLAWRQGTEAAFVSARLPETLP